jgi:hypothetical protein
MWNRRLKVRCCGKGLEYVVAYRVLLSNCLWLLVTSLFIFWGGEVVFHLTVHTIQLG